MRLNTILFSLGALGLPVLASANILVNGDFENQPNWGNGVSGDFGYTANTGNQIPGWTIEAGHAMTVHNTNWYPFISGSYSLNMDGEGYNGVNGDIYQDFASSISQPYALEFGVPKMMSELGITVRHLNRLGQDEIPFCSRVKNTGAATRIPHSCRARLASGCR